ncbi:V-type H+-transporting ATPase subunit G, partial [Phenoliferia sp. Uapishka_3]
MRTRRRDVTLATNDVRIIARRRSTAIRSNGCSILYDLSLRHDSPSSADPPFSTAQGISALLDAEKEASKIVAKAREYRTQRIKDARGEASKEIEELKAKKDAEFKEFEGQHSGDSSTSQGALDKTTTDTLAKIKSSFEQNKSSVVDTLLERVVEVKAAPHRNYVKV